MIVVTANWEIGDGSVWPVPPAGIMRRFSDDVARAAIRAGWRADGRYEPVPRVDVVYAGDTFDWLSSRRWLGQARPWHRGGRARAIRGQVVARSLRSGAGSVRGMLALVRRGLRVPRSDRHGRPLPGDLLRIPVGLTILEGNLDAGLTREPLRTSAERAGIGIGSAWEARGVRVVHGHEADPLWGDDFEAGAGPSLGASLRIDLLARFVASDALAGIDAARRRPLLGVLRATHPLGLAAAVSAWIDGLGDDPQAGRLRDQWLRSVSAWHRAARGSGLSGTPRRTEVPFDAVDTLADRLAAIDRRAIPPWPAAGPEQDPDLLGDLLGFAPPPATRGIVVFGHPPSDAPMPVGGGRCIALGDRQGTASDHDAHPPGVREITPESTAPPFPTTALVADRGRAAVVTALGRDAPEWSISPGARAYPRVSSVHGQRIIEAA